MKTVWLNHTGQPGLLIFFAGWNMDSAPFRRFTCVSRDVLIFFDYRDLADIPFSAEIKSYKSLDLAAWSLGCAAANIVALQQGWSPSGAIAINGTLIPEDDRFGIPARWMKATADNLLNGGMPKFVHRMCPDAASIADYKAAPSERDLPGAADELEALRLLPAPVSCVFKSALVSDSDRIILPQNQRNCWERYKVPAHAIEGGHYPFHLWQTWEEVLKCRT
jgi:pimeloyl-[acyl-carrier protein] methyl ester esterase